MTRFHAVLAVLIILAMLCLVMMANSVFASTVTDQQCVSVNTVKADIARAIPGSVIADMGGTEAAAFLTAFNAVPPVSQFTADYFVIVSDERCRTCLSSCSIRAASSGCSRCPKPCFTT